MPPAALEGSSRTFPLLVLALLGGLGGLVLHGGAREGAEPPSMEAAAAPPPPSSDRIVGAEVCADAGYLCPGLAERDEPRILRWADDTRTIRVGVPRPEGVPAPRDRELQDAAAAGLLAWQDKPFRIVVDRSLREEVDFVVRWSTLLDGNQLGRTRTRWVREPDGRTGMQVTEFVVVHRDPFEATRPLSPEAVQLAAAHEMGHALGLPHSDSDRDVMYPTNTATTLSARDYTTMSALYRVENGASIALPPAAGDR
jgi:hypothetical protein